MVLSAKSPRMMVGLLLSSAWLLLMGGYGVCQLEQSLQGSFPVSSFHFSDMRLGPYRWSYMRVELPQWFSSMIVRFTSNVEIDKDRAKQHPKDMPIMCFRYGGPPLPDFSETSLRHLPLSFTFNGSLGGVESVDWCLPFQKNTTLALTNEQISAGVWYVGFFNGVGPERTQSKMITRGRTYTFSTTLSIEGCATPTIWGPQCNQTIDPLFCGQPGTLKHSRSLIDVVLHDAAGKVVGPTIAHYHSTHTLHFVSSKRATFSYEEKEESSQNGQLMTKKLILCNSSLEAPCLGDGEMKFYSLDIEDPASQFEIVANEIKLSDMPSLNSTKRPVDVHVMCYARYNALPQVTSYDFVADISTSSLIVQLPEIGRWYIAVLAVNKTEVNGKVQDASFNTTLCFSLHWEVYTCPLGKAGLNCASNLHSLQRISGKNSNFPFQSFYLPHGDTSGSAHFPLEPLLSNSTVGRSDAFWTYLLLYIPYGAAGANLHVQLMSEKEMDFEIYTRYGGIPSTDKWNYHANGTCSSNGSMMLMSSEGAEKIEFHILYVQEGYWTIGIKHALRSQNKLQTIMHVSLVGCPNDCSSNGRCHTSPEETGLTIYSFCSCDRDHGGFDCSTTLVSHGGHIQQSIFLIGSNAAALLPAIWALRQKAFAEWVLFTASGISSALYHACDVGTWCPLNFHVLQFMDFWLSFMAVVSTFVFMATITEASKRAIHTCVSIITALLAATGATRSANIILVIAIGTVGLAIGWLLEFSSVIRANIFSVRGCSLDLRQRYENLCGISFRWQTSKAWFFKLVRMAHRRFDWHFLLLGFIFLTAAGTSWKLESSESYWIWHSLWHITIYTSSFFFLCSVRSRSHECGETEYELTQVHSPRLQSTEAQR